MVYQHGDKEGLLDTASEIPGEVSSSRLTGAAVVMESMLGQSPDWCISRQRTWGVPIALFIHRETEELHPDTAALIEKGGAEVLIRRAWMHGSIWSRQIFCQLKMPQTM